MIKLGRGRFELIKQQQQEATSYYKRKEKTNKHKGRALSARKISKGRREPILNEKVTTEEANTNQSNSKPTATTKYLSEVNTKPSSVSPG